MGDENSQSAGSRAGRAARPAAATRRGVARADGPAGLSPRSAALLTAVALVVIVLGAAAARLIGLATQPGGLYPDEAAEGLSALRILHEPGYHPLWFTEDGGREALFAYVVAAAFRLFGSDVVVLRGTSAVIGSLAVAAIYLAARRWGRGPALAAALWAAGSLWLIAVSRDGFRNIICVLFGALALAAIVRWYDRPGRRSALLAGIYTGIGLWTYQPLKLVPPLVILWLYLLRRRDRGHYDTMMRHVRIALIGFAVVLVPVVIVAALHPSNYFGRAAGVSFLNPEVASSDGLAGHVIRTLGQFFIWGDPNARHDVAGLPLLGVPLSILAALGAWRAWRLRDDFAGVLVLLAIPVMLVPPLISVEGGAPHFLRNLGEAPYLGVLIGLGCAEVTGRAGAWRGRTATLAAATGLAALLAGLGAASLSAYLGRPAADRYDAYTNDIVAMAQAGRGAGNAVVADDFAAFDIGYLDYGDPPTVVAPGTRLAQPAIFSLLVGRSPGDLAGVLPASESATAARAHPIAFDAAGNPRVYTVVP